MGDHMPVHLGSMPMSVAAAVEQCELEPGDVVMLNDPFRGGTHLPDITLVMPVYFVALRHEVRGWPRRRRATPPPHNAPTSTSLRAPTTPMSVEPTPVPWVPAAKSTRKASASRPSKSCGAESSWPMCWRYCSTTSAHPKSAKATWALKLPPARPAPSGCAKSASAMELRAPNKPPPNCSSIPKK